MAHPVTSSLSASVADSADGTSGLARPRILVLGGGAVVRECFAPALGALGLLDETTVVDPHASASAFRQAVTVVNRDYRDVLDEAAAEGRTHCVIALPNALHFDA